MYDIRVVIPVMKTENKSYKIYVYRSRDYNDINTIEKIKNRQPVFVIDESLATNFYYGHAIDQYQHPDEFNTYCYLVLDTDNNFVLNKIDKRHTNHPDNQGFEYFGPRPNPVPTNEYQTVLNTYDINPYTFVNVLRLDLLPPRFDGAVYFYSCIAVDESDNTISHLSKPAGIKVAVPYTQTGLRHIYWSNDMNQPLDMNDISKPISQRNWQYLCTVPYCHNGDVYNQEEIIIGDISNKEKFELYKIPVVEDIPVFDPEKHVSITKKYLYSNNMIVVNFPNVWQYDNKTFNQRKLKSYTIQTEYSADVNSGDKLYSDYSLPTFQSYVPVSIEKIVMYIRELESENSTLYTELDEELSNTLTEEDKAKIKRYEIIRQYGNYYKDKEHHKLLVNQYNIPIEENIGIFNEKSTQDEIKKQVEALPGKYYSITFYIIDVYNKVSKPIIKFIQT